MHVCCPQSSIIWYQLNSIDDLRLCVNNPAYLVPVPSQDKVGELWQEGHPV